jgi:chromosome segregation ATPase
MPVTAKFKEALEKAVMRFEREYEPLSENNLNDLSIIKLALIFRDHTDLILRDALRERCALINSQWRHWLFSSRLTDYIEEVLMKPEFQIERLYEKKLADLETKISTMTNEIETLTVKLPDHVKELKDELSATKQLNIELNEKLNGNQAYIQKLEELIKRQEKACQTLEARYAKLHTEYLRVLKKNSTQTQPAPKKIISTLPQRREREMDVYPKVVAAKS